MIGKPGLTLAALGCLAGTAAADEQAPINTSDVIEIGSHRGVAQDYLVLPSGGEITGQMRFVMADPVLGAEPLRFTDLALFGLSARWSLFERLELSASGEFLPKQP